MNPRLFPFALFILLTASANGAEYFFNQVGYYPQDPKIVYVVESQDQGFDLINAETGSAEVIGSLDAPVTYADGGLALRTIDISMVTTPGEYFIRLSDQSESPPIRIAVDALDEARAASLKSFFYNRASQEITEELGGAWARPLGHPDTNVRYHSSTGHSSGFSASPKGWYDAGDYGKYIVNGGYALGTLLSLHELMPEMTGDDTGIPESGNGVSDLLDEARWELEWFLTMQDEDGGVYHKCTTLNFVGFVMPHQTTTQRYFIGKSVTATLNFAACCAQAARIYADIDPEFSAQCLEAAEKAWTWAKANPNETYTQPGDVSTGAYGDNNSTDEFEWAAAQLFLTTGDTDYEDELTNLYGFGRLDEGAGWPNTRNLAAYSLATVENGVSVSFRQDLRSRILVKAQEVLDLMEANPIRSPLRGSEFNWGSNGNAAAKGVLFAYAYHISGDRRYAEGMADVANYLLGRNATGYSFLTGFGTTTPQNIHHRPSGADGVDAPVPGFLAGGPNRGREDGLQYPYPTSQPARSYSDVEASYASNEIAINWNAPLVLLLTALENSQPATFHPTPDFVYMNPVDLGYLAVLANDTSNPGAQLTAELISQPKRGAFSFEENGTATLQDPDLPFGNYYFQYRAIRGEEVSEPIVAVFSVVPPTFNREGPPPTAFEAWLFNYPSLIGDDALPSADPDEDGMTNAWESAHLTDPTSFDFAFQGGPRMLPIEAGGRYRFSLRAASDIQISDTKVSPLVRKSLTDGGWLRAGDDGFSAFSVSKQNADSVTGLADFVYETENPADGDLFIVFEVQSSDQQ